MKFARIIKGNFRSLRSHQLGMGCVGVRLAKMFIVPRSVLSSRSDSVPFWKSRRDVNTVDAQRIARKLNKQGKPRAHDAAHVRRNTELPVSGLLESV